MPKAYAFIFGQNLVVGWLSEFKSEIELELDNEPERKLGLGIGIGSGIRIGTCAPGAKKGFHDFTPKVRVAAPGSGLRVRNCVKQKRPWRCRTEGRSLAPPGFWLWVRKTRAPGGKAEETYARP